MALSISQNPDNSFKVECSGLPDYVSLFTSAPPKMELELQHGVWLVVSFSIWSIVDRQFAFDAITHVQPYASRLRVGLRPYDHVSEHRTWVPQVLVGGTQSVLSETSLDGKRVLAITQNESVSPIWVLIEDGAIRDVQRGMLNEAQLAELFARI